MLEKQTDHFLKEMSLNFGEMVRLRLQWFSIQKARGVWHNPSFVMLCCFESDTAIPQPLQSSISTSGV